jgi:hypothetical protein
MNPLRRVFFIPICAMKIFETATSAAAKVTVKEIPPAAMAGLNFAGITLPELVQLVSLVWLLILIVDKLWTRYRWWKKGGSTDESD